MTKIKDLICACQRGDLNKVRYLVEECRVDVNERGRDGWSPFMWACVNGRFETVRFLVKERHANVNVRENHDGCTEVHIRLCTQKCDDFRGTNAACPDESGVPVLVLRISVNSWNRQKQLHLLNVSLSTHPMQWSSPIIIEIVYVLRLRFFKQIFGNGHTCRIVNNGLVKCCPFAQA